MKCWIKKSEFKVFIFYDPKRNKEENKCIDKRIYSKRNKKFLKSRKRNKY